MSINQTMTMDYVPGQEPTDGQRPLVVDPMQANSDAPIHAAPPQSQQPGQSVNQHTQYTYYSSNTETQQHYYNNNQSLQPIQPL